MLNLTGGWSYLKIVVGTVGFVLQVKVQKGEDDLLRDGYRDGILAVQVVSVEQREVGRLQHSARGCIIPAAFCAMVNKKDNGHLRFLLTDGVSYGVKNLAVAMFSKL